MTDSPNYARSAWSMFRSLKVPQPNPTGSGSVDHTAFTPVLEQLKAGGLRGLSKQHSAIANYLTHLEEVDPDALSEAEALAFWINLYNATSLQLVAEASGAALTSVLRTPGVFHGKRVTVAGEHLSLDGIEHGKVRRFKEPRIHAALVCGSVSCPTLRSEPFEGPNLDQQLGHQMRVFLGTGGAQVSESGDVVTLSKVFQLYGGEFAHPEAMPTLKQVKKWEILAAVKQWMDPKDVQRMAARPSIEFQEYDWSLSCEVR